MDTKVPVQSILFMGISAVVCIIIPLLLLVYFKRRKNAEIVAFVTGCAVFVIFALMLEGAINYAVSQSSFGKRLLSDIWLYAIYGGLMAGIFEETGRFIAFKTVLKKHNENDTNALMYGAGHGGIEAIITVGITYIGYIAFALMINSGMISMLTQSLSEAQAESVNLIIRQLTDQPSWYFLAAILERCIAITAHIGLSVLVWFAAKRKDRISLYPLAILLHAAMDFITIIAANGFELPLLVVEGILALCTLLIALIAAMVWKSNAQTEKEVS